MSLPAFDPPEQDDDVSTLGTLVDTLRDAVTSLDSLVDQIALLRRATDDPGACIELAAATSDTSQAWAYARIALTCLTALQAVQP